MHYSTEALCFLYVADAEHDSLWLCVWRLRGIVQGQRQIHTDHLWVLQLQQKV